MRPDVLLMDEPCSALDPVSTSVIEDLIVELRRDLAIVIVTHNLQQAHRIGDNVGFMYLGDLVEYGTAEQVFTRPVARRTATTCGAPSADAPPRRHRGLRARGRRCRGLRVQPGQERPAGQVRSRQGVHVAGQVGTANTDVVVGQTAVLRGAGGAAAAVVVLRNRGPRAQAAIRCRSR